MPRRVIECGAIPVRSSPRSFTVPLRGGSSPKIDLISVDFPAPLGPTTVTISPSLTVTSTSVRMSTSGT